MNVLHNSTYFVDILFRQSVRKEIREILKDPIILTTTDNVQKSEVVWLRLNYCTTVIMPLLKSICNLPNSDNADCPNKRGASSLSTTRASIFLRM